MLALYILLMFEAVDVTHPIFGVLFHEMAALFACNLATALSLVMLAFPGLASPWFVIVNNIHLIANQVHQVTWLVVAMLR